MLITHEVDYQGCRLTRVVLLKEKLWFKWYHKTGWIVVHIMFRGKKRG